jgi:antitoxin CcdA
MLNFDDSPKRAINLSLNAKVLDMARELGINISQTVDVLLAEEVRQRYLAKWNEDNKDAIAAYNTRIEREGTFAQRIQRHLDEQRTNEPEGSR